jgi:hypothetical protein
MGKLWPASPFPIAGLPTPFPCLPLVPPSLRIYVPSRSEWAIFPANSEFCPGPLNKADHVSSPKYQCCITLLNLHKISDNIVHNPMRCHVYRTFYSVPASFADDVISLAYWIRANNVFSTYRFYNSTEIHRSIRIHTLQLNSHKVQQIHIYWWSGRCLSSLQSP